MNLHLPDNNLLIKKFKLAITIFFSLFSFFSINSFSQGNNLIEVTGTVENQQTKEPIPSVSVQIKGTVAGTITNNAGQFSIKTKNRFPLTLVFSSIGFEQQSLK